MIDIDGLDQLDGPVDDGIENSRVLEKDKGKD